MRPESRFVELYQTQFPTVYRAAYLLCGDRDIAEDAAQEAFARALERWHRIGDQSWVAGWVMTTALNVVRKSLARRFRLRTSTSDTRSTETDLDPSLDLRRAMMSLPRRQQEAVALYYIADMPLEQVAAVMRCENGTVKAHLSRAREKLARQVGGNEDAG